MVLVARNLDFSSFWILKSSQRVANVSATGFRVISIFLESSSLSISSKIGVELIVVPLLLFSFRHLGRSIHWNKRREPQSVLKLYSNYTIIGEQL